MGTKKLIGVGVGASALLLLAAAAVGAGYWMLATDESGEAGYTAPPNFVALGSGAALMIEGTGFDSFSVQRVDLEGASLAASWRWEAPAGWGAHPWNWRRADRFVVGEFHRVQGDSADRTLFIFDVEHGEAGHLEQVRRGVWVLADGALLAQTTEHVVELRLGETVAERWRTPLPDSGFQARPGLSETHAFLYDGTLRVFSREEGAPAGQIQGDIIGVDRLRGEALMRTEQGRVSVVDVLTGQPRIELDLAGGPAVVDGMENPKLLGTNDGRWLITYATALDHSTSSGGAGWIRHAPVWLASVDPASGEVAWRTELGAMRREAGLATRVPLGDERALPDPLVIYGDEDVEGGGAVTGLLLSVSLADGSVIWRTRFDGANRSNTLFVREAQTTWFRLPDPEDLGRSALTRFEAGRFTGAVFLEGYETVRAPALEATEGWLPGADGPAWNLISGSDLAVRASSEGGAAPADADAWTLGRLQLPESAR